MSPLLEKVIAAHGGLERWSVVRALDIDSSITGGIWQVKGKSALFKHIAARISTMEPGVHLTFDGDPRREAEWTPERTTFRSGTSQVAERTNARSHFDGQFITSPWDELDAIYFCSYALWTYFNCPFVFMRPGVETREIAHWMEPGEEEPWDRLHVTYPDSIVTHGKYAVAYFDSSGLLRRYDYVVDIMGGATGANYAHDYTDIGGLQIPQHRQVFGYDEKGLPLGPVLVDIQVLSAQLHNAKRDAEDGLITKKHA